MLGSPRRRSLAGLVVAITGGARGIGLATARRLAAEGAVVVIGDIDAVGAEQAAADVAGSHALEVDVTSTESFERFLAGAEAKAGRVDVLINNAGLMPLGRFADEDPAVARTTIAVNLDGVVTGMRLALGPMLARGEGQIINIASLAGKLPLPGGAMYTAAKHAVVGLTEAVRTELHGSGVAITVVMPSAVNTRLASGVATPPGLGPIEPDDVAAAIVRGIERRSPRVYVPAYGRIAQILFAVAPGLFARGTRLTVGTDAAELVDEAKRSDYSEHLGEMTRRIGAGQG